MCTGNMEFAGGLMFFLSVALVIRNNTCGISGFIIKILLLLPLLMLITGEFRAALGYMYMLVIALMVKAQKDEWMEKKEKAELIKEFEEEDHLFENEVDSAPFRDIAEKRAGSDQAAETGSMQSER